MHDDYRAIREFTALAHRADKLKKHADQSKIPVLTFRRLFIVSSCSKAYKTLLANGMLTHDVMDILDMFQTYLSDAEKFIDKISARIDGDIWIDRPVIRDEADALKYA